MDRRLDNAASKGDVRALQELLHEDSIVLSKAIMSTSSEPPLHTAALLGYTNFVKLVMSLNPELSRDSNQQGYTPMHLASLKGHLQIVIELLNFDKRLCFLKDSEGRTPLHCAAIKGRVEVITPLMCCCPESAMEVTFKGETLLHLAVSNSQSEVMMLLISSLHERNELNLLHRLIDCRDEDGNTALQLAIARKHKQMIKILSKETENHEDEITEQQAVLIEMDMNNQNQMIKTADETDTQAPSQKKEKKEKEKETNRQAKLATLHNAIIVLCSLLATCCFDAIISPPGGVWQNRPSNDVIHKENIKNISAFQRYFLDSNTTLTDLLAPNKAMSAALQTNLFLRFLFWDATCFMASLMTINLVTVTVCFEKKGTWPLAVGVMLEIILFSAVCLYVSILGLTSNAGAIVATVILVIFLIPFSIIFAPYFLQHCLPSISSRLASCYSRLRVHISNRYEKMIAKVLLTQPVTK